MLDAHTALGRVRGRDWDLHEWRHSGLTHLGEAGVSLPMFTAMSRHKKPENVRSYFHPSAERSPRSPACLPLETVGADLVSGSQVGLIGTLNVGMVLLNAERGWGFYGYGGIVSSFSAGAAASAALHTIALVPTLWLAAVLAAVIGLGAGVFGSLDNALIQTAADPAYLGRVTSVVMLTMVGLAPLSYPLVGAAIRAWGSAPVFVACGTFASLGVTIALASDAVRHAELPRRRPGVTI